MEKSIYLHQVIALLTSQNIKIYAVPECVFNIGSMDRCHFELRFETRFCLHINNTISPIQIEALDMHQIKRSFDTNKNTTRSKVHCLKQTIKKEIKITPM